MLESLELFNFEAHERRLIEFSPTLTTLCGKTDSGKSSIVRALRWVTMNVPAGTPFMRWGTAYVRAILKFDGHLLIRRAGDKNVYKLDGKKSAAFGRNVPDGIASLLNISDLNFQRQIEGPFWLSQSAPQVSRELNAIIDLGVIDEVMAYVASKARQAKAAVEVCQERIDSAQKQLDSLAGIPKLAKLFAVVEAAEAEKERISATEGALYTLVQQIKALEVKAAASKKLEQAAVNAQKAANQALEAQRRKKGLFDAVNWLRNALAQMKRLPLDDMPFQEAYKQWQVVMQKWQGLESLLGEYTLATAGLERTKRKAESLQAEAVSLLGEVCPLCNSRIGK